MYIKKCEKMRLKFNSNLCIGCKRCIIECALNHSDVKSILDVTSIYPPPQPRLKVVLKDRKHKLIRCPHCKKPKCIEVCETGAIYHSDGLVLIDYDKCTSCFECVNACETGAMFWDEYRNQPIKCDFCNKLDKIACVNACKVSAIELVGD